MPDYTYVVETDDHVYLRTHADESSEVAGEFFAGTRLQAAEAVAGGSYGGSKPGDQWYPVENQGRDCFVAASYVHIV